jgi:hypothetical protein
MPLGADGVADRAGNGTFAVLGWQPVLSQLAVARVPVSNDPLKSRGEIVGCTYTWIPIAASHASAGYRIPPGLPA